MFKEFPLDIHSQAGLAAEAALAANAQGKFWQMHDKMYANFRSLSQQNIYKWAEEIGLDVVRFTAEMKSGKYKAAVEKDMNDGLEAGVSGTPTFFFNGKLYAGSLESSAVEQVLQTEMAKAKPARP